MRLICTDVLKFINEYFVFTHIMLVLLLRGWGGFGLQELPVLAQSILIPLQRYSGLETPLVDVLVDVLIALYLRELPGLFSIEVTTHLNLSDDALSGLFWLSSGVVLLGFLVSLPLCGNPLLEGVD